MSYLTTDEFTSLSGETIDNNFDRLYWEASRKLDNATTGIDGYKKLKYAFPTSENDAEAVKRCLCKLIITMKQIEDAESGALAAIGVTEREDGTVTSKRIASMSSGSESISFDISTATSRTSATGAAVSDLTVRSTLYRSIIADYLSGIADANGVNLLYLGRYPCV